MQLATCDQHIRAKVTGATFGAYRSGIHNQPAWGCSSATAQCASCNAWHGADCPHASILTSSCGSSHAPAVVQNKRTPAATQGEQRPAGMYQSLCASTRARGWSAKSSQPRARLPPCRSQQAVAAHHASQALTCLEPAEAQPAQLQACILNRGGNTRHHAEACLQRILPCPFGYFPVAA